MENSNHTAHTANPFSIKFMESQKMQMENLNGVVGKAMTMSQNSLAGSFEMAANILTELIQNNMDIATGCFELSIKPSVILSKEKTLQGNIEQQAGLFNDQVVALLKRNTTNFESILQQFDSMAKSFTPLSEQLKKEMDNAVELSINTMRILIDSYINVAGQEEIAIVEELKEDSEKIVNEEENISDKVVSITKDVATAINKKMHDEAQAIDTVWEAMDGVEKIKKDELIKNHKKINSLRKHSDI